MSDQNLNCYDDWLFRQRPCLMKIKFRLTNSMRRVNLFDFFTKILFTSRVLRKGFPTKSGSFYVQNVLTKMVIGKRQFSQKLFFG